MSKSKMINCKSCNAEIAASAKRCPHCGAKNKKPIYKRPWFIVLIVIIVVGVFAGGGSDEPTSQNTDSSAPEKEQVIEYKAYDVDTLMDDLDGNAMKAAELYDDQYVALTGELAVIDSGGSYISVHPLYDEFAFIGVQCYIKSDEQKQKITNMSIGDTVVVKGKITDVGEVMGYSLDIDSIKVK